MSNIHRLMIAAPASGSGKSVIASGLMAAFSQRFSVQGFKVGPDYIDPMYHTAATGRPARNLDTWMLSPRAVKSIFIRASKDASLSIIEGAMGFFDGYGSDPFLGSSASIACLLKVPVILVIDCSKMSGSAAAIVHGFHTFCETPQLAGVICNRIGSRHHSQWLIEAIEKRNHIPVLGCIPRLAELQIPQRHLGLYTVAERQETIAEFLEQAGRLLSTYVDLERLLKIAGMAAPLPDEDECEPEALLSSPPIRLAVAHDEAFCFYYEDNLDELRRRGAEIVPFSPLKDKHLPPNVSGLYIGGGYPELYAPQLSANHSLITDIRAVHQRAMPIYAECGGLMYLTEGLHLTENDYRLVNLLPGWCSMGKRVSMGYRTVETLLPSLLCPAGQNLRGHEFHYSVWENPNSATAAYRILPRNQDDPPRLDGFVQNNLLASYIHLHFAQQAELAESFVSASRSWQKNNP